MIIFKKRASKKKNKAQEDNRFQKDPVCPEGNASQQDHVSPEGNDAQTDSESSKEKESKKQNALLALAKKKIKKLKKKIAKLKKTIQEQEVLLQKQEAEIEELETSFQKKDAQIEELNASCEEKDETIRKNVTKISKLQEENDGLRRKIFGSSSEKTRKRVNALDPNQRTLFEDYPEIFTADAAEQKKAAPETVYVEGYTRKRKKRDTFMEQFQGAVVEERIIEPTDEEMICPNCGTTMEPVGTEYAYMELVYIPAQYKVIKYSTVKLVCPNCDQDTQAEVHPLFDGSYASPSLVAGFLQKKYVLSLPFYRQEQELKLYGINISRGTMATWAVLSYQYYFSFVVDYIHRELLKRQFLMMDETPIQVLKEPGRRAETKSYDWVLRSGEDGLPQLVQHTYFPTRSRENAENLLKGVVSGAYVMTDRAAMYRNLGVKFCSCYAHTRRYFMDAIPKDRKTDVTHPAVYGVTLCNKLFEYERIYKSEGLTYQERHDRRLVDEKPVVEELIRFVDQQTLSVTSAKLNTALTYVRNQKDILMTYLEDGRCSLSNNLTENAIRPIVVGRKNWLFFDTPDGAEAGMGIYTIVEMAKLHKLDVFQYLKFLLEEKPDYRTSDEVLEKLMPWNENVQKICGQPRRESVQF